MTTRAQGEDWSAEEVAIIVDDYFAMLRAELLGEPYNKTEHRRALLARLNNRSHSSVEYKHRNISSFLVHLNLPYIDGYKPLSHRQVRVVDPLVETWLSDHSDFFENLADAPIVRPELSQHRPPQNYADALQEPPEKLVMPAADDEPWITRRPRPRIDFVQRDATNRELGDLGEEYVVAFEQFRLKSHGRDDLAANVEWVAQTIGDGLGFDVLSFDETDGGERYLEVKTTGLGKFFPFYVTRTELRCSEHAPRQFHLYRVFNFSTTPHLYILPGSLRETCRLEAVQYRGVLG